MSILSVLATDAAPVVQGHMGMCGAPYTGVATFGEWCVCTKRTHPREAQHLYVHLTDAGYVRIAWTTEEVSDG